MNDINVALVGPGAIGERHLRALRTRGGRVNAVVSRYADEAEAFAAEHGIDVHTTDLDAVLARSDVDAVVLASPSPFHHDQALACLLAGKPVMSEIPYALDLAGATDSSRSPTRPDCRPRSHTASGSPRPTRRSAGGWNRDDSTSGTSPCSS